MEQVLTPSPSAKGSTGTSIYMGAGNDSISFSGTGGHATTTYYFGKTDGKDTLSFANVATSGGITSRLQSTLLTVQPQVSCTVATWMPEPVLQEPSPSTMLKAGVATGTLFLNNVTGGSEAQGAGLTNITFVTVSTSTITALG